MAGSFSHSTHWYFILTICYFRNEWMKEMSEGIISNKLQENESILQRKDIDSVMTNCVASLYLYSSLYP